MSLEKAHGSVSPLSKKPLSLEKKMSGLRMAVLRFEASNYAQPKFVLSYHLLDVVAIALRAMRTRVGSY